MIKVTMTLDTFGLGIKCKDLVAIHIINEGTGTPTRGNYTYTIYGKHSRPIKKGRVDNWPRQAKTPIKLLQHVINDAYPPK